MKFIFDGLYYPVIGSRYIGQNADIKVLKEWRVFGWFSKFGFSVGIKCLLDDSEKPYSQFVLDAVRKNKDMNIRKEYFDDCGQPVRSDFPGAFSMYTVYTNEGNSIGDIRSAYGLIDLVDLKPSSLDSSQVSTGWHEEQQKAFGWSHRAMCGFGMGDCIFTELDSDGKPFSDDTLYTQHGRRIITCKAEAIVAAKNFARSVS